MFIPKEQKYISPLTIVLFRTIIPYLFCFVKNNTKETLNKSFLPFFATLSVTYFRALLKTAKRMLRIIQLFPKKAIELCEFTVAKPHIILSTNKTIDKKSAQKPYFRAFAQIFFVAFNWCLIQVLS